MDANANILSSNSLSFSMIVNASPPKARASAYSFSCYEIVSLSWASIYKTFIVVDSNWQEYPILIAVSILSPVNTQTLMPASLNDFMHSSTLSYNLS